jgi:antitoxin (DNA-binding transcriptional repressor) of toxin-antitoxin stability system
MLKVTVTAFSKNVFGYLNKVAAGKTVAVLRNRREIARLVPPARRDWRERVSVKPLPLVPAEELMAPM